MSADDLESILPASNDDTTDDEYELVKEDDDDEPPKKSSKQSKVKVTEKPKVKPKKLRLPARKTTKQIEPLHPTDPKAHALEPPEAIITKTKVAPELNTVHKIDLSKDAQNGIQYEDAVESKEVFVSSDTKEAFYKQKWFIPVIITVVFTIALIGVYLYCRRKFLMYDPISESSPMTGGHRTPQPYEDEYISRKDDGSEKELSEEVDTISSNRESNDKSNDDSKREFKSTPSKPPAKRESKPPSKPLPKRDKYGRFVKRK